MNGEQVVAVDPLRALKGKTRLQRDRRVPLYLQIRDRIVEAIRDDKLKVGDQLPSEPELVVAFGVGRPTVRQAIQVLRQEGLVVSKRGLGTFVAAPSSEVNLLGFEGLARRLEGRGIEHSSTVLRTQREARPPLHVLQVAEDSGPWWSVVRLRSVRLESELSPLCLEIDSFDEQRCPDVERVFARTGSATAVRQHFGIEIASIELATRAVATTAEWSEVLQLRRGAPVLAIERTHTTLDGTRPHTVSFVMRTDVLPLVDHLSNPAVL